MLPGLGARGAPAARPPPPLLLLLLCLLAAARGGSADGGPTGGTGRGGRGPGRSGRSPRRAAGGGSVSGESRVGDGPVGPLRGAWGSAPAPRGRRSLEWSARPDSSVTSLPVGEGMMTKYSNFSLKRHNISLTEHSSMPVEKNVTLESPSIMSLTCQFTTSGDLTSVSVTWKKDDELLKNYSRIVAGDTVYTQYNFTILNSKQMGRYSCLFKDRKEQRGTFNIKVPKLHGKNKPLITYVGDSAVLVCKCQECFPLQWTWYRTNGSVQVPIDVHTDGKYVTNATYSNETKLKIKHLVEEDGGSYWCHAVFQLGESEDRQELVVLSFLVPLKPFFAIVAEAVVLVAVILLCEVYTQKKKKRPDDGKEFEQIEQLKSDDSNGIENNAPRQRKNVSYTQMIVQITGKIQYMQANLQFQGLSNPEQLRLGLASVHGVGTCVLISDFSEALFPASSLTRLSPMMVSRTWKSRFLSVNEAVKLTQQDESTRQVSRPLALTVNQVESPGRDSAQSLVRRKVEMPLHPVRLVLNGHRQSRVRSTSSLHFPSLHDLIWPSCRELPTPSSLFLAARGIWTLPVPSVFGVNDTETSHRRAH
ncbi:embigin [Erethizon dorsatum]